MADPHNNSAPSPQDQDTSSLSPSLDHALLESLFYNEMMLMDDDSSSLFSESMVEEALLRDFGVVNDTAAHHHVDYSTLSAASVPEATVSTAAAAAAATYAIATASTATLELGSEKREKLLTQFATLASRLGITLPPNVVQSLSHVAQQQQQIPPSMLPSRGITLASAGGEASVTVGATFSPTRTSEPPPPPPPASILEQASMATAAVHTAENTHASRKRSGSSDTIGKQSAPSAAPPYSKRRKKPRLAESESKLAALQAENELLKRHLTNIANQSIQFDAERLQQEQKLKHMLEHHADAATMNAAVQVFSDFYSDYGRRRQTELAFHLEQLQRLANPTNFTKLGLWTLGQQSQQKKDLIAGILQRELEITPQQGRKILEQRQKIRDVCSNLKEVSSLVSDLVNKRGMRNNHKSRDSLSPGTLSFVCT